jgi:hypothetical protein
MVVGLITDDDGTAYREEIRDMAVWCQDNNLSLNVIKTGEIIADCRKMRAEHAPIIIDRAVVEQVESFKFIGVHITKLSWSRQTEGGTATPILTQGIWHGPSDPQGVLQLHH